MSGIVFFDIEAKEEDNRIFDIGALTDGRTYHSSSVGEFLRFVEGSEYLCGHNAVHFDLPRLEDTAKIHFPQKKIDTLLLSPLFFPAHPSHRLLKDDKLVTEELNNPVNDSRKAQDLFYEEVNAFSALNPRQKQILFRLLGDKPGFDGFFSYIGYKPSGTQLRDILGLKPSVGQLRNLILDEYRGRICSSCNLIELIENYPLELAYALALIDSDGSAKVPAGWVRNNYPEIQHVIQKIRQTPCSSSCDYCRKYLESSKALKDFFGFDAFRTYNNEPLQENAVRAAVSGRSLLAIFPTGGGKSLTFQLPALIAGRSTHALTVVISPLQSLMKDQVDNLSERGIEDAVAINSLLNPIERANAMERVRNGSANLLYISPEQLRSRTMERLLQSRCIARFVIDEAHCFSAWGQDFRVDYLYIGDFIRKLQESTNGTAIPVSCFTATAKQKVVSDIRDYFREKLGIELELFATDAARENLRYNIIFCEDDKKYENLRQLIESRKCSTIVYVSRTKMCHDLADRLSGDGLPALPYNGKMDPDEKIKNQEAFINDEVKIIVATSAFGMGVDKADVKLVVHYNISDSLESYVQEAGRAGRDPHLLAECIILFNENDLDKHFILQNQTKLTQNEINQVWKAVKSLTSQRNKTCNSALELAREAGWDEETADFETKIKTALMALENAGYVRRGYNVPHIYATSIRVKSAMDASRIIERSSIIADEKSRENCRRIISSLMGSKTRAKASGAEEAESRVDYLADRLGMDKKDVIHCINDMRQEGILSDDKDMSAFISPKDRPLQKLNDFAKLERFIIPYLYQDSFIGYKRMNQEALDAGIKKAKVPDIKTIYHFWIIKSYLEQAKDEEGRPLAWAPKYSEKAMLKGLDRKLDICEYIIKTLYDENVSNADEGKELLAVNFSVIGLTRGYNAQPRLDSSAADANPREIESALLYLHKIGALRLEGGFLILYSGLEVERVMRDGRKQYTQEDYKYLDTFYQQKIQQVHIVGEFANMMQSNYENAMQFLQDYFSMDYEKFIQKYFRGRAGEINNGITKGRYEKLFGSLSEKQLEIINDKKSQYISVAAGPGSGKTRLLVHKLAALLQMEDIKADQLLMLTFSRAAATEFKKRFIDLYGKAAYYVDIKTFHSYAFDLLGKIGSLDGAQDVVKEATEKIRSGEVEPERITKTVLVIDEAQDMDANEFALVEALIEANEGNMKVIAVGDDDQCIYEFRGASPEYFRTFTEKYNAKRYEMVVNYRSKSNIVALANWFAPMIQDRMKSTPISAMDKNSGTVEVVEHTCSSMIRAVVDDVTADASDGSVCVLTSTNEEAALAAAELRNRGVPAKLLQTTKKFRLANLCEIRYFLSIIDSKLASPIIDEDLWKEAKQELISKYVRSSCLENVLNLIRDFEAVNRKKYRQDLDEFIGTSSYEEFFTQDRDTVYVSTMHKAKGMEFDSVYLMLNQYDIRKNDKKRTLYVALTRAKSSLHVHLNNGIFANLNLPDVRRIKDTIAYEDVHEVLVQLSLDDVYLDYVKGKEYLSGVVSGQSLAYDMLVFSGEVDGKTRNIAKVSKSCYSRIEEWQKRGYEPAHADIGFMVWWKPQNSADGKEYIEVLPNLYLKRTEERSSV